MIDVSYRKKGLKVNQIWYLKQKTIQELLDEKRNADILFVHATQEAKINIFRSRQIFHTMINDLTISEEDMLAKINKAVKYQFRRSEKDEIEVRFYEKSDIEKEQELLNTFADIYERMYQSKGADTKFNMKASKQYLEADAITFSAVWHKGEMLVFHSYVRDEADTRLLHSASCFRDESADQSMIGRANKRLHWEDIKYFKQRGLLRYDWGGISDFENPNGIDEFKMKFGGSPVTYYNVWVGNSMLGKAAIVVMKLLKNVKKK